MDVVKRVDFIGRINRDGGGPFACKNSVSQADDSACFGLAEGHFQSSHRKQARVNQILQGVARAHGGELIGISDKRKR